MKKTELLADASSYEEEARRLRHAAVTAPEKEVENLLADAADYDAAAVRLRRIAARGNRV